MKRGRVVYITIAILFIIMGLFFFPYYPECNKYGNKVQECTCLGFEKPSFRGGGTSECIGIATDYLCYRKDRDKTHVNGFRLGYEVPCDLLPVDVYTLEISASPGIKFSGWLRNGSGYPNEISFKGEGMGLDKPITYKIVGTNKGVSVNLNSEEPIGSKGTLIAFLKDSKGNLLDDANITNRREGSVFLNIY